MKGKILKILVCFITIITIICCSVFCVSAASNKPSTLVGYPLLKGQGFSRTSDNYSYYRAWEVRQNSSGDYVSYDGVYWNFYGPSETEYRSNSFLFYTMGCLIPLMQNGDSAGCIIKQGSTITIELSSYLMSCLCIRTQSGGDNTNFSVMESLSVNGLIYGTNVLDNQFSVNGSSFTTGNGGYCSLPIESFNADWHRNTLRYVCTVPNDISALYFTWTFDKPIYIYEILENIVYNVQDNAGSPAYWQNENYNTPNVWIVCNDINVPVSSDNQTIIDEYSDYENNLSGLLDTYLSQNPLAGYTINDFKDGLYMIRDIFNSLLGVAYVQSILYLVFAFGFVGFLVNVLPHFIKR